MLYCLHAYMFTTRQWNVSYSMCNINMLEMPHLVKSRKWLSPVKDPGFCSSLGYEDVSCLKVRQWLWEKCTLMCTLHTFTCFQTFSHLWPSILRCRAVQRSNLTCDLSVGVWNSNLSEVLLWFSFCVQRA